MKKMKNWQVITICTDIIIKPYPVFGSDLTYNEARKMAKEYNDADHHGQIFKAVKNDTI